MVNPICLASVQWLMEREERFKAGDRNSDNGSLKGQQEAKASVWEDGRAHDLSTPAHPMKDGEEYIYGDSRPDRTEPSDTFVSVDGTPMVNSTREDLPEFRQATQSDLQGTSRGQDDEIRPQYDKKTDMEGQVLVKKEVR